MGVGVENERRDCRELYEETSRKDGGNWRQTFNLIYINILTDKL
jgi:hypothetical protein